MQNTYNMKLTDKEITAINKLDTQKCIEILHECAERLGLVTVEEYSKIMSSNKRTVYDHIKKGKLKNIQFCQQLLIIINN